MASLPTVPPCFSLPPLPAPLPPSVSHSSVSRRTRPPPTPNPDSRAPPCAPLTLSPRFLETRSAPPPFPSSSAPPPPPPPPPEPSPPNRSPDYHANVGSVIDALRDFYPHLLSREPDLTYFLSDVVLCDSTGYRLRGQDAYRAAFWMLRTQMHILFSEHCVSITSLYYDDGRGMVYVRWRLEGWFRGWVMVGRGGCVLDGLSVYELDWRGLVAVHRLENKGRRWGGGRVLFEDILVQQGRMTAGVGVGVGVGIGGAGGINWFGANDDDDDDELECRSVESQGLLVDGRLNRFVE